jgi:hypothetical protein
MVEYLARTLIRGGGFPQWVEPVQPLRPSTRKKRIPAHIWNVQLIEHEPDDEVIVDLAEPQLGGRVDLPA